MIISQGAEAIVSLVDNSILKSRPVKSYRLPVLDSQLRKSRTKREVKILQKLFSLNIPAPKFISNSESDISMSFIDGKKLRDVITPVLAKEFGILVGRLHEQNIIHGDLTTSNIIASDRLHLIDFGLSFISHKPEDKAVDLHVLDRALESQHFENYSKLISEVIDGYKFSFADASIVLDRLEKVKLRGRNKR